MIGDQLIKDLVKKLAVIPELSISPSTLSRMGKVYSLGGKLNGYIYLKAIGNYPHRWGITKNTVDKIEKAQKPWSIILLYDSDNTGYVISSREYRERVAKKLWPFHQGDYKITEGKSLKSIPQFSSIKQLVGLLGSELTEPIIIENVIETAKRKADTMRLKPSGESDQHKKLKGYVKDNPALIGIHGIPCSHVEYLFPSGDRADVAFECPNNQWSVIEVELEGLEETVVGLFQVVKYRALQEAVLQVKNLHGSVVGILVAKSILPEVKSLAELLGIRTFEISI